MLSSSSSSKLNYIIGGLATIFSLWILITIGNFARHVLIADPHFFAVERAVVFWDTQNNLPTQAELDAAENQLLLAIYHWPVNPDYLAMQARINAWRAIIAVDQNLVDQKMQAAIVLMKDVLRQRPTNPHSWAQYAEYLAFYPRNKAELEEAIIKVRELGPGEVQLQKRMDELLN